ncbi:MAG: hypothetical protein ACT4OX_02535 [Actinomycetota bacterium]
MSATLPAPLRSDGDRRMRALLRLRDDAPRSSTTGAENAFSKSILISAVRCLLTYVVVPLLGPVVNLSGSVGPALGLAIGAVSMVAIVASMRRFFAADHRFRWKYTAIGGVVLVLLIAQAVIDVVALVD